jgi:hypothetical protein
MAVDYITLDQLVDEIISIIGNSAAVETFCQTNYSASLMMFKSVDHYKLPNEDECPFMAIMKDEFDAGESVATWRYQVGLEIGVNDTSTTNTTIGNSQVIEIVGETKVEELTNIIYDEIRQNIPCNGNVDGMTMLLDSSQHPLYTAVMVLQINVPQPIGGVVGLN